MASTTARYTPNDEVINEWKKGNCQCEQPLFDDKEADLQIS